MVGDLVQRAEEFASNAHASIDQRRKYTGVPYIMHPKAVADMVAATGASAEVIAAAWLHDVVEDTPVSLDQVRGEFGDEVAGLVDDLTDVSRRNDGNRATRVAIDREHTSRADPRAKTVKLADVVHNLADIVEFDPKFAETYLAEKERLLEVLQEGDASLWRRANDLIRESRKQLDQQASNPSCTERGK